MLNGSFPPYLFPSDDPPQHSDIHNDFFTIPTLQQIYAARGSSTVVRMDNTPLYRIVHPCSQNRANGRRLLHKPNPKEGWFSDWQQQEEQGAQVGSKFNVDWNKSWTFRPSRDNREHAVPRIADKATLHKEALERTVARTRIIAGFFSERIFSLPTQLGHLPYAPLTIGSTFSKGSPAQKEKYSVAWGP